ncbi:hypothetical protein [Streptomyces niveus]|uniref:hypothetical protein n=1 Tax=Streptomyces niveus TaxID=193462 RepID=UPI0035DE52F0
MILDQKGKSSVAAVEGGAIDWRTAYATFGYPTNEQTLSGYNKLPGVFSKQLHTVFPDYDNNAGLCWATVGDKVIEFDFANDSLKQPPVTISNMFSSIPSDFHGGLSAACAGYGKTAWIFRGNRCTEMCYQEGVPAFSKVKRVAEVFKRNGQEVGVLSGDIDAAIRVPGTDKAYFFYGEEYLTCDMKHKTLVAGPDLIRSYFHGVPHSYPVCDAILLISQGNAFHYYFLGKYCVKLPDNRHLEGVPPTDATPRLITEAFLSLKGTPFAERVEGAVNGCRGPNLYQYILSDKKQAFVYADGGTKTYDLAANYHGSARSFRCAPWGFTTRFPIVYDRDGARLRYFKGDNTEKPPHEGWLDLVSNPRCALVRGGLFNQRSAFVQTADRKTLGWGAPRRDTAEPRHLRAEPGTTIPAAPELLAEKALLAEGPGGGRKRAADLDPGLRPALPALAEPDERGERRRTARGPDTAFGAPVTPVLRRAGPTVGRPGGSGASSHGAVRCPRPGSLRSRSGDEQWFNHPVALVLERLVCLRRSHFEAASSSCPRIGGPARNFPWPYSPVGEYGPVNFPSSSASYARVINALRATGSAVDAEVGPAD